MRYKRLFLFIIATKIVSIIILLSPRKTFYQKFERKIAEFSKKHIIFRKFATNLPNETTILITINNGREKNIYNTTHRNL